ncbi:unnamed protein product [Vitrella brassicaformis CCMP3155]|uniref:(S)-ureidoglycine aminohydrolase cupin domain-containing protein n=1 Tax=Vitrella brassicaformis (strain CCMP3155) TaxID=1169540 RepID=A0A0G4EK74_VITBC|nr:unnamed protein product [Vitrella brassicaformis CCMP3155]|eukprot:CEL96816.1 unnamed protein product [Vitrella brassicaformis CCMP3155]
MIQIGARPQWKIDVERQPPQAKLDSLGVKGWGTWGCEVSNFSWTYSDNETAYVIEGEVTVTPTGGTPVLIQAGDLVKFPKGMTCKWDVTKAIKKYYTFE